jgi:hypothetical protein
MLEAQVDKTAQQDTNNQYHPKTINYDGSNNNSGMVGNNDNPMIAAMSSIESIRSGESLIAAIDLIEETLSSIHEKYEFVLEKNNEGKPLSNKEKKSLYENIVKEVISGNPLLLNLEPYKYLQRNLKLIKLPDLEPALLLLPFHYVKRFLPLIIEVSEIFFFCCVVVLISFSLFLFSFSRFSLSPLPPPSHSPSY